MTPEANELLEDLRIKLEVARLDESELYPYLQQAMEMWGVPYSADTFEGLIAEAAQQYQLDEAARRDSSGRFIRGSGAKKPPTRKIGAASTPTGSTAPQPQPSRRQASGRKMTGSLLKRVGHWIGRTAVKTAAYAAGKLAQGTGYLASKAKNSTVKKIGQSIQRGGAKLANAALS